MEATSPRWRQVTPSQFDWEAEAFDTLRALLPDAEPFQAWTNFQFTDGGRIHEVDALVITPKGGYVLEVKAWSGSVRGDQGRWTQTRRDGSLLAHPNAASLTAEAFPTRVVVYRRMRANTRIVVDLVPDEDVGGTK